jgi:alkylated DNA repair dioxygenase AlkB
MSPVNPRGAAPSERFDGQRRSEQVIDLPGAELVYHEGFFSPQDCGRLLEDLLATTEWRQDTFSIYGRRVLIPRLNAWYGDAGCTYTYSRIAMEPLAWTAPLREVKARVESELGVAFNSVLMNLYRGGRDGVAWHADDEPELGPEPLLASVSFGATRSFQLRSKADRGIRHTLALEDGSVLVMGGATQRHWVHQVPKTARPVGRRLNLTFRTVAGPGCRGTGPPPVPGCDR